MLIEYYATDAEDTRLEKMLSKYKIDEWFNPEDDYYILETQDPQVVTIMSLLGIELYVSGKRIVGFEAKL
jgi:hypothetical protein